ncbi:unnamed protein product [Polarella glacialis]|uniref:Uncharacterized protein n=1 Tax=Polarella glacialis TaxID=89957 RepID=A0A813GEH6_POLGL|nr:unnamed protein product [Polarella glacialis]
MTGAPSCVYAVLLFVQLSKLTQGDPARASRAPGLCDLALSEVGWAPAGTDATPRPAENDRFGTAGASLPSPGVCGLPLGHVALKVADHLSSGATNTWEERELSLGWLLQRWFVGLLAGLAGQQPLDPWILDLWSRLLPYTSLLQELCPEIAI